MAVQTDKIHIYLPTSGRDETMRAVSGKWDIMIASSEGSFSALLSAENNYKNFTVLVCSIQKTRKAIPSLALIYESLLGHWIDIRLAKVIGDAAGYSEESDAFKGIRLVPV